MIFAAMAIAAAGLFTTVSCDKYDDSELKEKIEALDSRISGLESSMKQLADFQTIKDKVNAGCVISGTKDNGDGSYTLSFSDGSSITIRNGQNGTPGDPGDNGATPSFKIENETWYVSYDNGANWTEVGSAIDHSLFSKVNVREDGYVELTLADGSELTIATGSVVPFSIDMDESDILMSELRNGEYERTLRIPYTVKGAGNDVRLSASVEQNANYDFTSAKYNNVVAYVEKTDETSGNLVIIQDYVIVPDLDNYFLNIDAPAADISLCGVTGNGQSCIRTISLLPERVSICWDGFDEDAAYLERDEDSEYLIIDKTVSGDAASFEFYIHQAFASDITGIDLIPIKGDERGAVIYGSPFWDSKALSFSYGEATIRDKGRGYTMTLNIAENTTGSTRVERLTFNYTTRLTKDRSTASGFATIRLTQESK